MMEELSIVDCSIIIAALYKAKTSCVTEASIDAHDFLIEQFEAHRRFIKAELDRNYWKEAGKFNQILPQ